VLFILLSLYDECMDKLIALSLSVFLIGCSSVYEERIQENMESYVGKSIDLYIEKNTPHAITPLTSGGYKYDFKTRIASGLALCTISYITDKDGIIIKALEPYCS
tara:strand:- start:50 stop:364 length:315 start_codon:yes stop_codon:yes gene_type:complete